MSPQEKDEEKKLKKKKNQIYTFSVVNCTNYELLFYFIENDFSICLTCVIPRPLGSLAGNN